MFLLLNILLKKWCYFNKSFSSTDAKVSIKNIFKTIDTVIYFLTQHSNVHLVHFYITISLV